MIPRDFSGLSLDEIRQALNQDLPDDLREAYEAEEHYRWHLANRAPGWDTESDLERDETATGGSSAARREREGEESDRRDLNSMGGHW